MARPISRLLRSAPFDPLDDPDAAPGSFQGAEAAPPFTWRRARQNLVWIYVGGLIFLVFAIPALSNGDPSRVALAGRVTLVIAIGISYVAAAWVADTPLWVRVAYIVGFVALLSSTATYTGWQFVNFGVYVAILMATLIPWRYARFSVLVWGLLLIAVSVGIREWVPASMGLVGIGIGMATGGGIESGRVARRLSRVEERVSVLAVAAERERIGRDLHDILGHSLTAIAIKSSLAARLVEQDPDAARQQLAEIEEVSRQALADVRATASGFREVRVATEIASARSVLMAAGIEAHTPTAIPPMSDRQSELFGYVVREAITNVVRHSEATTCTIVAGAGEISVADDGRGFDDRGSGSGLAGLAERIETAGGYFQVESHQGGGTTVLARLEPAVGSGDVTNASVLVR